MKPISFKEQNKVLEKPVNMTDDECQPLPVWTDGSQCISCWHLSFRERLRALFTGRVWLSVTGTETQPPVWLQCAKTVFNKVYGELND